jgi:hypothetical protein
MIEFTEEQMEKILELQKQEGFETVQDTVMAAVSACLKD